MSDDGCWFGPGAGLGARHKPRVSFKAARRAVGAAGACASSAAQRCGPVPLPLVLAGLGGRGCRLGLHVGALALAPLSIVQAVLSGGLVFLAVLAERYFGFRLG